MLKRLIGWLFARRPAHIGSEEHMVGSVPGCPGCEDYWERRR